MKLGTGKIRCGPQEDLVIPKGMEVAARLGHPHPRPRLDLTELPYPRFLSFSQYLPKLSDDTRGAQLIHPILP